MAASRTTVWLVFFSFEKGCLEQCRPFADFKQINLFVVVFDKCAYFCRL
ncbi:hypothetical protein HMPREF1981_02818 [Bacteroides pyogenes F0041]|uniref:Uncharacterized protein n=1 Tax=Bacteroides pyogenes F0041 TaxID=1321819 RepID=U2DQ86_9BACE|nr:hypothetical protein HMPREF1981_02818 [Bacteroides pyogenes F0041]